MAAVAHLFVQHGSYGAFDNDTLAVSGISRVVVRNGDSHRVGCRRCSSPQFTAHQEIKFSSDPGSQHRNLFT